MNTPHTDFAAAENIIDQALGSENSCGAIDQLLDQYRAGSAQTKDALVMALIGRVVVADRYVSCLRRRSAA